MEDDGLLLAYRARVGDFARSYAARYFDIPRGADILIYIYEEPRLDGVMITRAAHADEWKYDDDRDVGCATFDEAMNSVVTKNVAWIVVWVLE